jgi:hypothetical protein
MPKIETIHDKDSYVLPTVSELRATQKEGNTGEGLNKTDCTELNAVQGHQADIREFVEGEKFAKVRLAALDNEDADISRLDRTNRDSWPEITEL